MRGTARGPRARGRIPLRVTARHGQAELFRVLALPLSGSVAFSKLLNLSEPVFPGGGLLQSLSDFIEPKRVRGIWHSVGYSADGVCPLAGLAPLRPSNDARTGRCRGEALRRPHS